jgi:hypothetical protein
MKLLEYFYPDSLFEIAERKKKERNKSQLPIPIGFC